MTTFPACGHWYCRWLLATLRFRMAAYATWDELRSNGVTELHRVCLN